MGIIGSRNRDFQSVMPHAGVADSPVKSAKNKQNKSNVSSNGQGNGQSSSAATIPVNVIPNKSTTLTPDTTKWENVDTSITHGSREGDPSEYGMTEGQMRREGMASCEYQCSQITKFVFVGGMRVAENLALLREKGIRRIVNCANAVTSDYHTEVPGMKYLSLNLVDGRVEDISWFVCQVIQFIVEGCNNGEGILVHCEKGISRSCSLVIAYKMWASGIKWKDAFDYVKMRRKVCSPNTAFTCNLIEMGEILTGNSQEATVAFRCSYHATYDTETPVLKTCRNLRSRRLVVPCTSLLHPKGVFVLRAVKDGKHYLFLWKGSQASEDTAIIAETLALKMRSIFTTAKDIIRVKEGLETEQFLRFLIQDGPVPESIDESLDFDDYFDFRPALESNKMMYNADEDFPSSYLPNLLDELTRDRSAASLHSQSSTEEHPPVVVTQAVAPAKKASVKSLPTFSLALGSLNAANLEDESKGKSPFEDFGRGMVRNDSEAGSIALPGMMSRASSYRGNAEDKDNASIPISRVSSNRNLDSKNDLPQMNLLTISPKDSAELQAARRASFRLSLDAVTKESKENKDNNSTIVLSRTPSFRAEEDIPPIVLSRQSSNIRANDNAIKEEELSGKITLLNKINNIISTAKSVSSDTNVIADMVTFKETSRSNSSNNSNHVVPKLELNLPVKSEPSPSNNVQQQQGTSHVIPRLDLHVPIKTDSLGPFDSTPSTARESAIMPAVSVGERPVSPITTGLIKNSSRKKIFPLSEVGIISSRPGSSERRMFGSPRVLPFTPLSALSPTYGGEKTNILSPSENSHTSSSTNLVGIAMDTQRSSSTNEGSHRNTPTNEKLAAKGEGNIPSLRLSVLNDANRPTSPSAESSARSTRDSIKREASTGLSIPDLRIPKISDLSLPFKTSNNSNNGNVNTNRSSSTGDGGSSRKETLTPTDSKLKLSKVPSAQLNLPPTIRRDEKVDINMRSTDKLPGMVSFNKPLLYHADYVDGDYEWRAMGVYDDEDLEESGVYLLICPNMHHHIWIGSGFDIKACNIDVDDDGKPVMSRLLKWAAKVDAGEVFSDKFVGNNLLTSNVSINLGGSESEAFWNSFNEGF